MPSSNRYQKHAPRLAPLLGAIALCTILLTGQTGGSPEYHVYAGSTHAHTSYTWSHGDQFVKGDCSGIQVYAPVAGTGIHTWTDGYVKSATGCAGIYVIDGSQYPSPNVKLKADWQEYQGPPSDHFRRAKAAGYDFYIATDHSQEAAFQPPSADNPQWVEAKKDAAAASDSSFVAIAGFEYSENDGPRGEGHINVMNTDGMLNALVPGVDLPYFYKWLATAKPNGDGPVVASFNHPTPDQYNNWDYRDPKVTDVITMLEVINSNNKIHYPAFVNALDHGWKVSPVCGNDNHGTTGITKNTSRTFVLARNRTKADILDAMKHRRTYASHGQKYPVQLHRQRLDYGLHSGTSRTVSFRYFGKRPGFIQSEGQDHQDRYCERPRRNRAGIHRRARLLHPLDADHPR